MNKMSFYALAPFPNSLFNLQWVNLPSLRTYMSNLTCVTPTVIFDKGFFQCRNHTCLRHSQLKKKNNPKAFGCFKMLLNGSVHYSTEHSLVYLDVYDFSNHIIRDCVFDIIVNVCM